MVSVMDEKTKSPHDSGELKAEPQSSTWFALALVWQLGYTIAIPVVVFALLGRFLDKKLDTSPLLLLIGIFASIAVSSVAIYRKTIKILDQTVKSENKIKDKV